MFDQFRRGRNGRQHRNSESFDVHHHGLRRSVNLVTNQAKSVVLSATMPLARSAGCQETGSSGAMEARTSNPYFGVIRAFYPIEVSRRDT